MILKLRRRFLGEDHPDTLRSMNNLAVTLRAHGDLNGARGLQEKVLEISRRTLGEEHPGTSTAEWNLLLTLLELGDESAASAVFRKLVWLFERDPESLGAVHCHIRNNLEPFLKT